MQDVKPRYRRSSSSAHSRPCSARRPTRCASTRGWSWPKRLLVAGRDSVTEICAATGFASLGTFEVEFARRVGASPSRSAGWRRRRWRCRGHPAHLPSGASRSWRTGRSFEAQFSSGGHAFLSSGHGTQDQGLNSVMVDNRDKALKFYTEVLGFTKCRVSRWAAAPAGSRWWRPREHADSSSRWSPDPAEQRLSRRRCSSRTSRDRIRGWMTSTEYLPAAEGAGVVFTLEPTEMGVISLAVFADTCGNLIQIYQPPSVARRRGRGVRVAASGLASGPQRRARPTASGPQRRARSVGLAASGPLRRARVGLSAAAVGRRTLNLQAAALLAPAAAPGTPALTTGAAGVRTKVRRRERARIPLFGRHTRLKHPRIAVEADDISPSRTLASGPPLAALRWPNNQIAVARGRTRHATVGYEGNLEALVGSGLARGEVRLQLRHAVQRAALRSHDHDNVAR